VVPCIQGLRFLIVQCACLFHFSSSCCLFPFFSVEKPRKENMATSSTAYARNSKPITERKQPKIVKNLSKFEPKKLGIGLVAGCCLALLTYISLAKLFSIYSPVFGSFIHHISISVVQFFLLWIVAN
jgi:hypothetical protein